MGRLIIKTALVTLCCAIILFLGTVGVLYVISPRKIGEVLDSVGEYQTAVKYYQRQYDKNEKDQDLVVLLEKASDVKNYAVMEKYYAVLLKKDNFNEICNKQDEIFSKNAIKFSEYSYINYTVSTFYTKDFAEVLSVISSSIDTNGYTQNNCVRALLLNCKNDVLKAQLSQLKEYVEGKKAQLNESERQIASEDILSIDLLLG